jgi:ATP-dependent phosphoenolpyruvate carboxykinase
VPGIPDELMHPERGWSSKIEYQEALSSLAIEFIENYTRKYKGKLGDYSAAVDAAIPVI